jgi:hypothetical protein
MTFWCMMRKGAGRHRLSLHTPRRCGLRSRSRDLYFNPARRHRPRRGYRQAAEPSAQAPIPPLARVDARRHRSPIASHPRSKPNVRGANTLPLGRHQTVVGQSPRAAVGELLVRSPPGRVAQEIAMAMARQEGERKRSRRAAPLSNLQRGYGSWYDGYGAPWLSGAIRQRHSEIRMVRLRWLHPAPISCALAGRVGRPSVGRCSP